MAYVSGRDVLQWHLTKPGQDEERSRQILIVITRPIRDRPTLHLYDWPTIEGVLAKGWQPGNACRVALWRWVQRPVSISFRSSLNQVSSSFDWNVDGAL